jgi:hypothetical protein
VREKVRGEYGFSSLMKQKKKAEICFVIYIAGFFFKFFFCYEVIVKQIFKERPANHYSPPPHANSFVLGPAVINTDTHSRTLPSLILG